MNILIVDDDEVICGLLKYWLLCAELKKYALNVYSAQSCTEAFSLVQLHAFDIILIDVKMPKINGLDGTEFLAKNYPLTLIIAMSSENDKAIQEEMLRAGAYDYINKPIIFDIFVKRVLTYIRILHLRQENLKSVKKASLFDSNIFNYQITFPIQHEDHLAEFWDMMLTRLNHFDIDNLHDTISKIYNLGLLLLANTNPFMIFLEENDTYLYITLKTEDSISPVNFEKLSMHYDNDSLKKDQYGSITLKLAKRTPALQTDFDEHNETSFKCALESKQTAETATLSSEMSIQNNEPLEVYDFLDDEDLDDMEQEIYKLPISIHKLKEEFDFIEIEHLYLSIDHITSILSLYPQLRNMYSCLLDFSSIIKNDLSHSDLWFQVYPLIQSYIEDIITWYRKVFFDGATSLHFMDASFVSNIELIQNMILPSEETLTTDDIFDF